jgi:multidrug efflux pump subunit AcrA (membrane-fusion protein)
MKHHRIILFSALAGIFLLLSACTTQSTATTTEQPTAQSTAIDLDASPDIGPEYIIAEGIVLPEQKAMLSFVNGGIVKEIYFEEGDSLKKGDTLASLSGYEQLNAEVASAELALLDAKNKLDTFLENDAINRAKAELKLATMKLELEDALDNRKRMDLARASDTTLDGLRADFVLASDALKEKEEDYQYYADNKPMEDLARAQSMLLLTEARKAYEKVANNLNYALGFPDADEVSKADAQISLAKANVDRAQADYDAVKDGADPDQLALLESSQKAAEARLASARKNLEDSFLTAPFTSQLVSSNMEVGQYINAGETAVSVGNLDQWVIETTDLTELDIVNVQVGDKVGIQFDALPDVAVQGTVQKVKLFGENIQGDVTYTVTVLPDEKIEGLRWNMTAFMKFYRE